MRAMVLEAAGAPLVERELPDPEPGPGQMLIRVRACGVCRTDLHIVDGELTEPKLPLVPGHQVVGEVVGRGEGAERFALGARVGVPWLAWTDGTCDYCRSGRENLCPSARFTGYDVDGGYAELTVADERFCFAPAGPLVPLALRLLRPGGVVVCAGIHMSDIPAFPYADLWRERSIRSVANLTRADGEELLALAPRIPIRTTVSEYPLERAADALEDLRGGRIERGGAVLRVAA